LKLVLGVDKEVLELYSWAKKVNFSNLALFWGFLWIGIKQDGKL
jgi:hypothetical protein